MPNAEELIVKFIEPLLKEHDCYLVELKGLPGKNLQVYLDADDGVNISACAHINRALKRYLEEEGILGDDFSIEVSSPGIGHPLKLTRQYVKNVGRFVKVTRTDGEVVKGKLVAASESGIAVEQQNKPAKGRSASGGKEDAVTTEINFDEISKTVIQVKF